MTYDALASDIALLNVYFGESTAMGEFGCCKDLLSLRFRVRAKLEEDDH